MRPALALLALVLSAAAPPAAAQDRVFFGNLHSHTGLSDGVLTPEDAFRHARAAGLDFLLISEHNHGLAGRIAAEPQLYTGPAAAALIPAAGRATEDGRFVALYGQEFSSISRGNHMNVFDVPAVIDVANGEFGELVDWIEDPAHRDTGGRPALLQLNHPWSFSGLREYGGDDFGSQDQWIRSLDAHAQLIEVINGPAFNETPGADPAHVRASDYFDYLNLGFHVGPTANQDNHRRTWGDSTRARTGVVAEALTKEAVLGALRARHVFATTDENLTVVLRVEGHLMGDVIDDLPAAGDELDIRLTLRDADEPDASYRVDVLGDAGPGGDRVQRAERFDLDGDTVGARLDGVAFSGPGQYVLLEVRQIDETPGRDDRAWTAPVWFEGDAAAPGPDLRIASLLPNGPSPESQHEEVRLRNRGEAPVDMAGWRLVDAAGNAWTLDRMGTLPPGGEQTVRRNGERMALNNGGDTVALVDPQGVMVHTVSYGRADEGEWISF